MRRRSEPALPLFAAGLAAIYLLALGLRAAELLAWEREPERHFADGVPVAGTDSYLYFRYAREAQEGIDHGGRDRLRRFPDGFPLPRLPLLSECVARVSDWSGLELHRAGLWLGVFSAGLFVFPLGLFCQRLGAPLAGLWGAFLGCFGTSYGLRTALHRVDTDAVNLCLLFAIALLALEAGLRRSARASLAFAAAAGLAARLFGLWYGQPGFALLSGLALCAYLAARRVGARRLGAAAALYAVAADPRELWRGASDLRDFALRYLLAGAEDPAAQVGALHFPSVLAEISELRALPALQALGLAGGHPLLGLAGAAGFALFAWQKRGALLPLAPLLALAALGLASAQRFLMYLGPFLGMGCGWLVGLALARLQPGARGERWLGLAGVAPLGLLLLWLPASGLSRPSISLELIRSLQRSARLLPPGSAIASGWAHGHLVGAITGAATFNDGQEPDPVVEQLLDRGLSDPEPRALYEILSFLARHGRGGVEAAVAERGSYAGLLDATRGCEPPPGRPLHLLLSDKMLRGFGNHWWKGRWDFAAREGRIEGYDIRACRGDARALVCSKPERPDLRVDLERGLLNGRAPYAHFVRVAGGEVVLERSHAPGGRLWLQLIETPGDEPEVLHLLEPEVFASNFNQMFVLGRADPALFRPLASDFPTARLYALEPAQPLARERAPRLCSPARVPGPGRLASEE